jgi:hypothetical protein
MRTIGVFTVLGCCLFALATLASAQSRKAGLWTMTTTTTMAAPGANPAGHPTIVGPHSIDVCLTQALIDKFGAPLPRLNGSCQITRLSKRANGVYAEMVCSGATTGKATMESTWTADSATGSVHFVGTAPRAMDWTSKSTSVFKSADCGTVQPYPMPAQ